MESVDYLVTYLCLEIRNNAPITLSKKKTMTCTVIEVESKNKRFPEEENSKGKVEDEVNNASQDYSSGASAASEASLKFSKWIGDTKNLLILGAKISKSAYKSGPDCLR